MLSLSLFTLGLATIGAYAKPMVRAAASLEVSLSTPADKVTSVSELRVIATVKNVGDEDLKVIRLGTVLDNKPNTRSFIVTKDGKQVPFIGVETSVPADPSEDGWVVIPVGESVIAEHDVFAAYNFSAAGAGNFTFDPVPSFQVVGLDDAIEANTAYSVSITVTDVSKRELDLEKRIRYECDDADEKRVIENASGNANYLAKSAAEYTLRIGRSYDPIYKRYFGSGSRQKVFDNFRVIEDVRFSDKFTVDCPGWSVCHGNGPIFIEDRKIHFCSSFFDLHPIEALCGTPTDLGSNRAVFTFVAFASLPDFQFSATVSGRGCDYAAGLPQETQVLNIDNYLCFAVDVFRSLSC